MDNRTIEEVRANETKLIREIKKLEEQLDYIRSGEYYNQLRFERDMLQNVVDNGKVSKEDKEFIDMTHRNTELLEENEKLKNENMELRADYGTQVQVERDILNSQWNELEKWLYSLITSTSEVTNDYVIGAILTKMGEIKEGK